jgi:hypothetical protein
LPTGDFSFDNIRNMQHYIDSCSRKIDSAQHRLEKTPEEVWQTNAMQGLCGTRLIRRTLRALPQKIRHFVCNSDKVDLRHRRTLVPVAGSAVVVNSCDYPGYVWSVGHQARPDGSGTPRLSGCLVFGEMD